MDSYLLSTSSVGRPLVHGHRGCRGLRPENTLPAFLHAVALGVDVLELDVVISADAQVVVSHEPWPSALYCTAPDGRAIALAEERQHNFYHLPYAAIREFDCGRRQHPGFPEQQTMPAVKPLLAEVIRAADELAQQLGRPLPAYAVELKSTVGDEHTWQPKPGRFVDLVLATLSSARVLARATLLSFDVRLLRTARAAYPDLPLCLLVEQPFETGRLFETLGFVPAVFGPDFQLLSATIVREIKTVFPTLQLVPWTVNEPADLQAALSWPLTGITTDYPNRLLAMLRARQSK